MDRRNPSLAPAVTPTSVPAGATGIVTIDLARLGANWRALADLVAPAECAAVVKADAYGLGATEVIPALAAAGCRTFFVATLDEGLQARRLVPHAEILVLDGVIGASEREFERAALRPVLSTGGGVRAWAAHCRRSGRALPATLHVDTGLNRLGLGLAEIAALEEERTSLEAIDVELVMSHLASADVPGDPMNARQLAAFAERRSRLPAARASLAASDGLMLGRDFHFDLVRPGYALYGGQASHGATAPVAPVVHVAARILQVAEVPAGEAVGYSATFTLGRPSRLATIAAGYADGVARSSSAATGETGGVVAIRGFLAPIVGRVSMDLITVDVTDVPGPGVQPGEWVDLLGPDLPLEAVGLRSGTIGYEVLTRLGRRFHRVYTGAEA